MHSSMKKLLTLAITIAIAADEAKNRSKIEPYIQQQNITLDIWTGADIGTLDHVALGNALPATIVLDNDGTPIGRIMHL